MKRTVIAFALFAAVSATHAVDALAAEGKPIQLSLWNTVQIVPRDQSVSGLRLAIYGENQNVVGFDWGIFVKTNGLFKGIQWGWVGITEGNMSGWQATWVNIAKGEVVGVQGVGIYNYAGDCEGLQVGIFNKASDFSGLMLGIVNVTDGMNGLQIGLVNIINSKEKLKFFPIVNWSF